MSILLEDKEIDDITPTKEEVFALEKELTSDKVEGWDTMTRTARVMMASDILTNRRTAKAQAKKIVDIIKRDCPETLFLLEDLKFWHDLLGEIE